MLISDCFMAASERNIHIGDYAEVLVINEHGIQHRMLSLRKD
jgi:hypothetical protein